MTYSVLGIDVGITGGLCLYSADECLTWEMPTYEVIVSGNKRKKVDARVLMSYIRESEASHVFIERVGPMPKDGAVQGFKFGFTAGVVETAVIACGVPFTYVQPAVWKKHYGLIKTTKDQSRERASQIMPNLAHNWSLKRQNGVAEAALIALYGFNKTNQQKGE